MLKSIAIKDYSLLKNTKINLHPSINIITGESGSGKTLFLNSFSEIGNTNLTKNDFVSENIPTIEIVFEFQKDKFISNWLETNDIDLDNNIITFYIEKTSVRKNRTLINNLLVPVDEAQKLLGYFLDLNKQHNSLLLKDKKYQIDLYDDYIHIEDELNIYKNKFKEYNSLKKTVENFDRHLEERSRELEYLNFTINEIEEHNIKDNEAENLQDEIKELETFTDTLSNINSFVEEMKNSNDSVCDKIQQYVNILNSKTNSNSKLSSYIERLDKVTIELKETCNDIESWSQSMDLDNSNLEEKNERLSSFFTLFKKYRINSTKDLLHVYDDALSRRNHLSSTTENFDLQKKQFVQIKKDVNELANSITNKRIEHKERFCNEIENILSTIGLDKAKMNIKINDTELHKKGNSSIEILWDPNNKKNFIPISKTASGGELNRLLLTLKSLSKKTNVNQTLIFDEIDSGLSGETSIQLGKLLSKFSNKRQIICITHQASVAAIADKHFLIKKVAQNSELESNIQELSYEERVDELSNILSGEHISDNTRETAKELLNLKADK